MKTGLFRFVVSVLALVLAACGAEFDPGSRVTDFRLMAVQADAPFALPGETVHLRALYHEPFGRPVELTWMTCVNPRDTSALGCLVAPRGLPMQAGSGLDQVDIEIPADILDGVPADARPNSTLGVVTVACPGTTTLLDPAKVPQGSLPVRCTEYGTGEVLPFERYAVSVKRIFVREHDRNANPAITEVFWDGAPWPEGERRTTRACRNDPDQIDDCRGGERHHLDVTVSPGAESGRDEFGRDFSERVVVDYYATEGTFAFDVRTLESSANDWAARRLSAGKTQTLWFVAHDNRGGVGWASREVDVQ